MNKEMDGRRAAAIIGAYTGFVLGPFADIHEYADELFPGVGTISFGLPAFAKALREKSEPDFIAVCEWLTAQK